MWCPPARGEEREKGEKNELEEDGGAAQGRLRGLSVAPSSAALACGRHRSSGSYARGGREELGLGVLGPELQLLCVGWCMAGTKAVSYTNGFRDGMVFSGNVAHF